MKIKFRFYMVSDRSSYWFKTQVDVKKPVFTIFGFKFQILQFTPVFFLGVTSTDVPNVCKNVGEECISDLDCCGKVCGRSYNFKKYCRALPLMSMLMSKISMDPPGKTWHINIIIIMIYLRDSVVWQAWIGKLVLILEISIWFAHHYNLQIIFKICSWCKIFSLFIPKADLPALYFKNQLLWFKETSGFSCSALKK